MYESLRRPSVKYGGPLAVILLALLALLTPAVGRGDREATAGCEDVTAPGASRETMLAAAWIGPVEVQPLWLALNIPAYRVDVIRDGRVERSFGVAIGQRRYASPTGDFEITRIVWNPWWYPPDAAWARDEHITPPGPGNPMGRVKLLMRGAYYLHGTPFDQSIGSAASHGCFRMRNEDAIALARIVQQEAGAAIGDATVDSLTTVRRTTRVVELPRAVPLRIVYQLAELRGDTLVLHADVYRRGISSRAQAKAVLARAGVDTLGLDKPLLDSLVRQARAGHASAPLAMLAPRAGAMAP